MPQLSRSQILVYGAVGVVVLLLGTRWVRGSEREGEPAGEIAFAGSEAGAVAATPGEGAGGRDAVVHVAGAVRRPGVYRLPAGARVAEALERAGGATGRAEPAGINLAARLSDGQQVVVPERAATGAGGAGATTDEGPVSLGSATTEQLETIEGIGPVTAEAIVEFRDQRGGLSSVEELDEVSGIGPATLEALRSRLQP